MSLDAPAAPAELLRAQQKDAHYAAVFHSHVEDVVRSVVGTRVLHTHADTFSSLSRLVYAALSTWAIPQSLGDEYVDILPVATRLRRLALAVLHAFSPALLLRLYSSLRRLLSSSVSLPSSLSPLLDNYIHPFHLACFFLYGVYCSFPTRLLGIRHVATNRRPPLPYTYQFLGILVLLQLSTRIIRSAYALKSSTAGTTTATTTTTNKEQVHSIYVDDHPLVSLDNQENSDSSPTEEKQNEEEDSSRAAAQCTLCLGPRRSPTATECGHVFCWSCIVSWARERYECPLCRQSVRLSALVVLNNYY